MQRNDAYDEATLLGLLSEGNRYAFEILYNQYRPKIYHLALKFLKSVTLAEEVVQEVFLKIWLKRSELVQVRNFSSYIFIATKNTTLDVLRKLAVKAAAEGEYAMGRDVVDNRIDYPMMEAHYAKMVKEAADLLPAQQAKIFRMAKIDGLSHDTIAEQMGISKLTVKKQVANALQVMHQHLDRYLAAFLFIASKYFDS